MIISIRVMNEIRNMRLTGSMKVESRIDEDGSNKIKDKNDHS